MIIANIIAYILVLAGALNWGLVGIFNWNLVEAVFGGYNVGSIIIYILVLLGAIWLIVAPLINHGQITICENSANRFINNDKEM